MNGGKNEVKLQVLCLVSVQQSMCKYLKSYVCAAVHVYTNLKICYGQKMLCFYFLALVGVFYKKMDKVYEAALASSPGNMPIFCVQWYWAQLLVHEATFLCFN